VTLGQLSVTSGRLPRFCVAAMLLAASAWAAGPIEKVLYTFQNLTDGYYPESYPLIQDKAGNLYGTTTYGGDGSCVANVYVGCGTIFEISPPTQAGGAWTDTLIWQFQGGVDGGYPEGLVAHRGSLYGVAGAGGDGSCTGGCGYLYELIPPTESGGAWSKNILYDFSTEDQVCGITAADPAGNFYGAGPSGNDNGRICKLTRPASGGSGAVSTLYIFKGVPRGESIGDGSGPLGVTFDSHGDLWGTTGTGGFCQLFQGGSCFGTIFELRPPAAAGDTWIEGVVYRFSNLDENPVSGVTVDKSGAVYGVTLVETYQWDGGLTVISNFSDLPGDPFSPTGGVVLDSAGNVHGTTAAGGQYNKGTVYELTPTGASGPWTQTVLHSFAGGTDGWNPQAPMILGSKGAFYGTTQIGGK
jgi:uncharacterized repeat protein (TIGR03803 family)